MKPLAQNTLIQNRYLIVHLIGKGGMGEVYLAVDQRLGSAVALKRTFYAGDEALGSAFEREARVLARLRHPVLPKVSDHFTENGQQFLVMEHISGDDLAKRLEMLGKPFPLSWVMFWADQLLDALSYLHSHEPPIIHRDIKPQNLKLTDENHIILLDFGLSKSQSGQTQASGTSSGSSTGSVVGYTPHYAPMEQIRGVGTSPKSDLYSLSATLYQLMTNSVPVDALTRADALISGMTDPLKSPSEVNEDIPPAVSEVILKGMEINQDKRFESAKEMQRALRKAYAEMQQAMAAKTVVMSQADVSAPTGQDESFQATEVMNAAQIQAISNPTLGSSDAESNILRPTEAAAFSTAIPGTGSTSQPGMAQSDIKTEVFSGQPDAFAHNFEGQFGNTPQNEFQPTIQSEAEKPAMQQESFAPTVNYTQGDFGQASPDSSSAGAADMAVNATMPFVALEAGQQQFSSQKDFQQDTAAASVSEPGYSQQAYAQDEAIAAPSAQTAAVPAAKKSSTGKFILILGGLFLFFVVLLAAGGGGAYYYYYVYLPGAVEASPTPEETPLPTPSPEETPLVIIDNSNSENTNSEVNSNSDISNQNSNTNGNTFPGLEPSPEPNTGPNQREPRQTQKETQKEPPAQQKTPKPQQTRTPKPSKTPDILQ
jgi:serine/threonine protein kinase